MTKDLRIKGKYALVWISDAQQKDESDIINELSPNSKMHTPSEREKPNASKSISYKRKHSNDYTSTNLQKPIQGKTIKDNV